MHLYQKIIKFFQMMFILLTHSNISIKKDSRIFGTVKVEPFANLSVNHSSRIDGLEIVGVGEVFVEKNVQIKNLFINLGHSYSKIIICDDVFIANGCKFIVFGEMLIGNGTLIAPEVLMVDTKHIFGKDKVLRESGLIIDNITISKNVWIGAKSIILPGVNIYANAIIGAGSVVNKDCLSNGVYVGNPAKKVKELE